MGRITKYLSAVFLLVAGLTLVSHNVIPHDHHQDELFGCSSGSGTHQERNHGHSHGFPAHCHAFNDLLSEKFAKIILRDPGRENIQIISFHSCRSEVFLQPAHFVFLDYNVPEPDLRYSKLTLFRAPPLKI